MHSDLSGHPLGPEFQWTVQTFLEKEVNITRAKKTPRQSFFLFSAVLGPWAQVSCVLIGVLPTTALPSEPTG